MKSSCISVGAHGFPRVRTGFSGCARTPGLCQPPPLPPQDSQYVVAVRNYSPEDGAQLGFHKGDIIHLQPLERPEPGERPPNPRTHSPVPCCGGPSESHPLLMSPRSPPVPPRCSARCQKRPRLGTGGCQVPKRPCPCPCPPPRPLLRLRGPQEGDVPGGAEDGHPGFWWVALGCRGVPTRVPSVCAAALGCAPSRGQIPFRLPPSWLIWAHFGTNHIPAPHGVCVPSPAPFPSITTNP